MLVDCEFGGKWKKVVAKSLKTLCRTFFWKRRRETWRRIADYLATIRSSTFGTLALSQLCSDSWSRQKKEIRKCCISLEGACTRVEVQAVALERTGKGLRTRHGYEADLWHIAVMMKSEQGARCNNQPTAAAGGNMRGMYSHSHYTFHPGWLPFTLRLHFTILHWVPSVVSVGAHGSDQIARTLIFQMNFYHVWCLSSKETAWSKKCLLGAEVPTYFCSPKDFCWVRNR